MCSKKIIPHHCKHIKKKSADEPRNLYLIIADYFFTEGLYGFAQWELPADLYSLEKELGKPLCKTIEGDAK